MATTFVEVIDPGPPSRWPVWCLGTSRLGLRRDRGCAKSRSVTSRWLCVPRSAVIAWRSRSSATQTDGRRRHRKLPLATYCRSSRVTSPAMSADSGATRRSLASAATRTCRRSRIHALAWTTLRRLDATRGPDAPARNPQSHRPFPPGGAFKAVDGVDVTVDRNEVLAIVGEFGLGQVGRDARGDGPAAVHRRRSRPTAWRSTATIC